MKNLSPFIIKIILGCTILACGASCQKAEESCGTKTLPDDDRLHRIKSISSVWYVNGHEEKKGYEMEYDEAGTLSCIKYKNAQGAVTAEEYYDFSPSLVKVETYSIKDDRPATLLTGYMPLGTNGLIQGFYYEGNTYKKNYTYNESGLLTSLTDIERGDGLKNTHWSCGDMTESDIIFHIKEGDNEPYLQKESLKCRYSDNFNNYSIDLNALTNEYLYPNYYRLMPRMQGISSLRLMSHYYLTGEWTRKNMKLGYECDEEGRISSMTVTDMDYAEAGEENRTVYTFTYYPTKNAE